MLRVALTPPGMKRSWRSTCTATRRREVAIDRGVSPASVCQLLQRAERRVGRYLGYL